MQSGIRITFRHTEWGRFCHPCKKAPNKSKKVQKPRKGNATAPMTTSSMDYIIDVANLYPIPLLQILFWKLKLKSGDTCVEESTPRDIEKGTHSR